MTRLLGQKIVDHFPFSFADTFRYQFVLSPEPLDIAEFNQTHLGRHHLYTCPLLDMCRLTDGSGHMIGAVLGQAVDASGEYLETEHSLELAQDPTRAQEAVQTFLKSLAGRFVCIIRIPGPSGKTLVYVDTASSYGTVFDKKSGIVASSLLLCLTRDIHPNDFYRIPGKIAQNKALSAFIPEQDPTLADSGFLFGQTADKFVHRIPANHVLDVNALALERTAPTQVIEHDLSPQQAADVLVPRLQQIMRGFTRNREGYFAISGGRDSRILLACTPPMPDSRYELYCYANNWMSTFDLKVAKVMAASCGKDLLAQVPATGPKGSFFHRPRRSQRLATRLTISNGFCQPSDEWWRRGYAHNLKSGVNWLRGNFLELLTARYWPLPDSDPNDHEQHLLNRLGAGKQTEDQRKITLGFFEEWRGSLGSFARNSLHDLVYQELALNASQAFFHGTNEQFYIGPASDHLFFQTAMRVAVETRQKADLYNEILRRTRPDLIYLPLAKQVVFHAKYMPHTPDELMDQMLARYKALHMKVGRRPPSMRR